MNNHVRHHVASDCECDSDYDSVKKQGVALYHDQQIHFYSGALIVFSSLVDHHVLNQDRVLKLQTSLAICFNQCNTLP